MIQLYRKGTSHVCRGVTCEMATVNEYSFEHLLDEGWFFDPKDCYPETKPEEALKDKVELPQKETPKVADSKVTDSEKSVLDETPNTEKPNKTAAKTATKK